VLAGLPAGVVLPNVAVIWLLGGAALLTVTTTRTWNQGKRILVLKGRLGRGFSRLVFMFIDS
jgi:hypothetical protein